MIGEVDLLRLGPDFFNKRLYDLSDFQTADSPCIGELQRCRSWLTPGNISHLEINLGKFRLAIFAAIFIAETFGYLEIPVDTARANQKLLGLLWGLLEGVKRGTFGLSLDRVRMRLACGDEEFSGTLWRGSQEDGGLDLDKI